MGKRKDRLKQFAVTGNYSWGPLHPNILRSGVALLRLALDDRGRCMRIARNHWSMHGPGAIVLAVTAFDLWLSEVIVGLALPNEETRALFDSPITQKYERAYEFAHDRGPNDVRDLQTMVDVRQEIVHHFPRPTRDLEHLPAWFPNLERKGLLLVAPHASSTNVDLDPTQKLGSYGLAYWVFRVIEQSAADLVRGSPKARIQMLADSVAGFGQYRSICSPEELDRFDKGNGIDLNR